MLRITIPHSEHWDETREEFISTKEQTLALEHSLVSLSKWESKWCKPYLTNEQKTFEEIVDYIKCMTITQNVDPNVYLCLTSHNMSQIKDYIEAPMTATRVYEEPSGKLNREQVTSELVYYWMTVLNIPFECEKWHLNRLLTLIRVCNAKNSRPRPKSKRELMRRNTALNAQRRKRLNSKG